MPIHHRFTKDDLRIAGVLAAMVLVAAIPLCVSAADRVVICEEFTSVT